MIIIYLKIIYNIFYMLRISKNTYRVVWNINQSDDRFHLLLCTFNNGIQDLKGFIPDWKTWVTAVRLHYVNCSGDSWVEGVHRYLRQSGFMRILSAIVLYTLGVLPLTVCHSKTLVTYFQAKFQVCRGALTSRVKQLWKIMSRRKDKSIC